MQRATEIINSIKGKFAVGVSGGADSMCLLSLIISAGRGNDVTVLHINHGIRDTANHDTLIVKEYCQTYNIKLNVFNIDVPAQAKRNKRSIETQARLMRHNIFMYYCQSHNVPICLAHNRDDNVETILMHIFRGCGIGGLVGMSERDSHICQMCDNEDAKINRFTSVNKSNCECEKKSVFAANECEKNGDVPNECEKNGDVPNECEKNGDVPNECEKSCDATNESEKSDYASSECEKSDYVANKIIRPLINVSKSKVYGYVKSRNIPYAEDETNADTSYRRNHIRALLPLIEQGFEGVRDSLINLSQIAAKTQSYIDSQLDYSLIISGKNAALSAKTDGNSSLFVKNAVMLNKKALKTPLAHHYVLTAIKMAGLAADYMQKHIDLVVALGELDNGKSLDLPHSLRVYNEYNHLTFEILPSAFKGEREFFLGDNSELGLCVCKAAPKPVKGRIIVDADKLTGAKWRMRQEGDRFYPCGGKPKKLKQYLNEKKIPLRVRDNLPVLAIGSEVLVLADIQLSDTVKITADTKNAYEIKAIS